LGNALEAARHERVGLIEKQHGILRFSSLEQCIEILRPFAVILAFQLRVLGADYGALELVGDRVGCERLTRSWAPVKIDRRSLA
jgi:hypothetical protein